MATTAIYLNALDPVDSEGLPRQNRGVHVVTVNDYLAKRDHDWMGPVFRFLGLTVGFIQHDMDERLRQEAYRADITYGTNNEFGFDYLRDNMKFYIEDLAQRGHNLAVVDEVDSILIDEACTLIISVPPRRPRRSTPGWTVLSEPSRRGKTTSSTRRRRPSP